MRHPHVPVMRLLRSSIALLLFVTFGCTPLFAQRDTLFWFAAPEQSIHTQNFDRPIVLRITAYDAPAQVTIDQPAGGGMPVQTVAVAAGGTVNVDLTPWIDVIENKPPNTVLNYGLRIRATQPVSLYYEVVSQQCQCSPEIYVPKGRNGLGTAFTVPMQDIMNNNPAYNPVPYSSFDIVATQDNTTVTITPTQALVGHPAGMPFSITLNAGQTYCAQAVGALPAQHPAGSTIVSNNPVAVTMKDDLLTGVYGGCSDPGGDQLVPDALAGTEYIAVKGFVNAPGDRIMVLGLQNGTGISINGAAAGTVDAGQTWATFFPGTTESMYISTTAPVHVLQLTGFGCEVGMAVLPPIVCTGSNAVSFTRSSNEALFITLLTRNGDQGAFLYNGAPGVITAADFAPVPGTGDDWVAARLQLTAAQAPLGVASSVVNTSGLFHLGYINGGATGGCRFGFFSNYGAIDAQATAVPPVVCSGGDLQLLAAGVAQATYTWTGPAGFTSTEQNPLLTGMQADQAGDYIVAVSVPGCGEVTDTVSVSVTTLEVSATVTPNVVCAGGGAELEATGEPGALFSWSGPSGFIAAGAQASIPNAQAAQAGTYTVTMTVAGCDPVSASVDLFVENAIGSTLTLSACPGQPVALPDGTVVDQPGVYNVPFTTGSGCDSVVVVTVQPLLLDLAVTGPPIVCAGSPAQLTAGPAQAYDWSPAELLNDPASAAPVAVLQENTTFTVVALLDNGCEATGSVDVAVLAAEVTAIAWPAEGVLPLNTLLQAMGMDCDQYIWYLAGEVVGEGPSMGITLPDAGTFTVDVECINGTLGCRATAAITVLVFDEFTLYAPNAFTPDGDGINDVFMPYGVSVAPNDYRLTLFDRWGRVVFESLDPGVGWDGRIAGIPAPIGVYSYRISARSVYKDGQRRVELTGHVTLVR
jgi:gliding motility-associated-like protein